MNKKGFTLVEGITVIMVIGIIFLIVVPNLTDYLSDSQEKTFEQSVVGLIRGIQIYKEENDLDEIEETDIHSFEIKNIDKLNGTIRYRNSEVIVVCVDDGIYKATGTIDNLDIEEGTCD